jgi:hypothetical protein
MAKTYAVRSYDLQRSYGTVTRRMARGMVRRGEATFCDDCNAIQLIRGARVAYPRRGVSANPASELAERYVDARFGGGDKLALAAIEGWSQ